MYSIGKYTTPQLPVKQWTQTSRHRHCIRISSLRCSSIATETCIIRRVFSDNELMESARIRAEAYYEEQTSRFVQSFVKQFKEQEFRRLTSPQNTDITLIAIDGSDPGINTATCLGTLDIQPDYSRQLATILSDGNLAILHPDSHTMNPSAITKLDNLRKEASITPIACSYVLNVVVSENSRGTGIGTKLVNEAKHIAQHNCSSAYLFAHVDAVNEPAIRLYKKCGFLQFAVEGSTSSNETNLGKRILLCCPLV